MPATKRKLCTYLWRNRHGVYYFRALLPRALAADRPAASRDFRRSLRTDSWREAAIRGRQWRVRLDVLLDDLMKRRTKHPKSGGTVQYGHVTVTKSESAEGSTLKFDSDWKLTKRRRSVPGIPKARVGDTKRRGRQPHPSATVPVGLNVSAVISEYLPSIKAQKNLDDKTIAEYKHALELFAEILFNPLIRSVRAQGIDKYRETLRKVPVHMSKRHPNKSVHDVLKIKHTETLSLTTVNQQIERVSQLFEWAIVREYAATNPAKRSFTASGTPSLML